MSLNLKKLNQLQLKVSCKIRKEKKCNIKYVKSETLLIDYYDISVENKKETKKKG